MQGAFTADFLFSIEKRAVAFNEYNYNRLLVDAWYPKVIKERNFDTKSERLTWMFDTASIDQLTPQDGGETGSIGTFDELATVTTEFFPAMFGRGFKMGRLRFENFVNGSSGQLDPLGKWAAGVGAYGAYLPQRQVAQLLLNGANITGYDGVPFWSTSHPVHPLIPALGTYANDFTSSASGAYPGAVPIDDSQTFETALTNLAKVLSYIATAVLQPNGNGDPRMLVPKFLLHPTRMAPRVNALLDAAFLPVSANSGGGAADVRPYLKRFRMIEPVEAKELGAAISYTIPFGAATGLSSTVSGSDTTYYIVCEEASMTELGAIIVSTRKPFAMTTFAGDGGPTSVDAVLGRSSDIESHYKAWLGFNPGHPYTIFRCRAS